MNGANHPKVCQKNGDLGVQNEKATSQNWSRHILQPTSHQVQSHPKTVKVTIPTDRTTRIWLSQKLRKPPKLTHWPLWGSRTSLTCAIVATSSDLLGFGSQWIPWIRLVDLKKHSKQADKSIFGTAELLPLTPWQKP
jgi:hypothetical protein